MILDKSS